MKKNDDSRENESKIFCVKERIRHAALFDVDGTVVAGSSERMFFWALTTSGFVGIGEVLRWAGTSLWSLPQGLDVALRGNRRYLKGKRLSDILSIAERVFERSLRSQIAEGAFRAVAEHRSRGDLVVLLSGSLGILVEPVGKALGADVVAASELEAVGDILTGRLRNRHPIGEGKVAVAEALAKEWGFDLSTATAYADRSSDIPLLSRVGKPVAVNPSLRLRRHAERVGWPIVEWRIR